MLYLVLFSVPSFAGGVEPTVQDLMEEIKALKTRVTELESKLGQEEKGADHISEGKHTPGWNDRKRDWIECTPGQGITFKPVDLTISTCITGIVQGVSNANNAGSGEDSIFDGSWKADIDIEKRFGDWGLAFLELEAGQGDTIASELSLFSNVNNNANDTGNNVIINKFFYEQYLLNKQVAITVGKLDPTDYFDQNKFADNDSIQFLGQIFNNTHALEWPAGHGFGGHVAIAPEDIKFLEFDFGYFEGDSNWEDVFDHGVFMGQINLKPSPLLGTDSEQWEGNYRFYSWLNGRDHVKLGDPAETKEVNYGFGMSADQRITDVYGVFARCEWERPDVMPASGGATIEWSWSTGAQMTGKYWNRKDDTLAVAIGQDIPSGEYKDAGNPANNEGHIEAYYRVQFNEYIAISPDFQVVWNPNGVKRSSDGDGDTIFVYGTKAHLSF